MRNIYSFLNRSLFSILIFLGFAINSHSQIGFGTTNPDSSAMLEMKSLSKGLLIPRMDSAYKTIMANKSKKPAHSLLVFDLANNMFYFYDSTVSKWTALNPFNAVTSTGDITTRTTGNVGIGTNNPKEKLDVNGNINSSGSISANQKITSNSVSANTASIASTLNAGSISSTGNISSTATVSATQFVGNGTIPLGGIIMWNGSIPPAGFALCDGKTINGIKTPNLSGLFVLGAGTYSENIAGTNYTYNYSVGNTGGEAMHQMTVAEMPSHNHHILIQNDNTLKNRNFIGTAGGSSIDNAGSYTENTGGNSPHENRPPYYVLAYIIRVQ